MIFNFFFNFLFAILNGLISILPTGGSFPTEIASTLSTVWGYIKAYDFIIPTSAIVICLTISFSWITFVFFWKVIHWILRKIPFLHLS